MEARFYQHILSSDTRGCGKQGLCHPPGKPSADSGPQPCGSVFQRGQRKPTPLQRGWAGLLRGCQIGGPENGFRPLPCFFVKPII